MISDLLIVNDHKSCLASEKYWQNFVYISVDSEIEA